MGDGSALQRLERGTPDDGGVVSREVVLAEELLHFHFHELEELLVVDQSTLFRKTTM